MDDDVVNDTALWGNNFKADQAGQAPALLNSQNVKVGVAAVCLNCPVGHPLVHFVILTPTDQKQ
jgi:hypothetical protein